MEFSKQQIEEAMINYCDDNDAFGDVTESKLINEVFTNFKSLLLENNSDRVSSKLLQEHVSKLEDLPKDIFEDFILYINMTEVENRLL